MTAATRSRKLAQILLGTAFGVALLAGSASAQKQGGSITVGLELDIPGFDPLKVGVFDTAAETAAAAKAAQFGPELSNYIEKSVLLQTLDHVWKEHLLALDYLRQGIGLRAYGQRDPLNEYKREAFMLFTSMLEDLKQRVTTLLANLIIGGEPQTAAPQPPPPPGSTPSPSICPPAWTP